MDWKATSNNVLLVGLFVAMVTMFNQANGRLDTMNECIDVLQADMNRRFDTMQAENQHQHDAMQQVLRVFEGRITRLEEKPVLSPKTPSKRAVPLVGRARRRPPARNRASSVSSWPYPKLPRHRGGLYAGVEYA